MQKYLFLALLGSLIGLRPAHAWWPQGHSILTEAAVRALPPEVPAYFRNGAAVAAHCAQDPDLAKNKEVPTVADREAPEHYIDFELLKGQALPSTRNEYLKLIAKSGLDPKETGFVPYAIVEWTERLAVAFAEARRWPNNPYIQQKTLVYAGYIGHYAEDMCMPLHTTIDHDGRHNPDGSSPKTGIHGKIDSLIEKMGFTPQQLAADQVVAPAQPLWASVIQELQRSRAQLDRAYELEAQLPPDKGEWKPTAAVRDFSTERARSAVRFTASLYLAAWQRSAKVELPDWLQRENSFAAAVVPATTTSAPVPSGSTTTTGATGSTTTSAPTGIRATVFFSPKGGCTEAVIAEIGKARHDILVQAYSFTSAPISKALADAFKRGVKVKAVLDRSNASSKYSGATFLQNAGVPVKIDAKHAIAHNKIMIIDGQTLITGSFNFTAAAEKSNAENLLVLRDCPQLIKAYTDNWNAHEAHSTAYQRTAAAGKEAAPAGKEAAPADE